MEARGQGSLCNTAEALSADWLKHLKLRGPRVTVVDRLFGNLTISGPNVPEGKNLKSKLCRVRK